MDKRDETAFIWVVVLQFYESKQKKGLLCLSLSYILGNVLNKSIILQL